MTLMTNQQFVCSFPTCAMFGRSVALLCLSLLCVVAEGFSQSDAANAAPVNVPATAAQTTSDQSTSANQDTLASCGGPNCDRLIEVARDVAPEWAATLEAARAKDAETFRATAAKFGKRLCSLAVLRERKPELYRIRVEELRVQGQLEALGSQWMSARLGNRSEDADGLESQIRALAGTLVDLNLRSRAMELAEIDAVMRTMRTELERDARARTETIEKMVSACRGGSCEAVLGGRTAVLEAQATPPSGSPAIPTTPKSP